MLATIKAAVTAAGCFNLSVTNSIDNASIQRAKPEHTIARQASFFHCLFDNLPDAVAVLDIRGRIIRTNRAFEDLFGFSPTGLRGKDIDKTIVPDHLMDEAGMLSRQALAGRQLRMETTRRNSYGALVPVRLHTFPIMAGTTRVGAYVMYVDLSETESANRQAAWEATHDSLTGLINRVEFEHCLAALLPGIAGGAKHGLLYIDLDDFKIINDICGHRAGDALLCKLTSLIEAELGESDVLARLGGDQFGVLVDSCTTPRAEELARQLMHAITAYRFVWNGRAFSVTASIGVVGVDPLCRNTVDLFAAADAACYSAKEKGGNRVRVYRREDSDIARQHDQMEWISRLAEALEADRFLLYYQAIAPLTADGDEHWYEILLRFRARDGQIVTPDNFIPAAERYHFMPALDRWVVRKVFAGIRRGINTRGAAPRDVIAINLSGETIGEPHFRHYVRDQLRRFRIPPEMICFEITETAAIENLDQAITFINDMRALGCTLSLDDFGSGLSSFPYLKALHIDYLKIDGAFVRNMAEDAIDCAMVETINRVGKIMGVKTIAEYVERNGVLGKLRELGVDFAQGYDIHVPEPWCWTPVS